MNGYLAFGALVAMAGVLTLSQATRGVGLIGVACFLAIAARISQATELKEWQAPLAVPKITTGAGAMLLLLAVLAIAMAILSSLST